MSISLAGAFDSGGFYSGGFDVAGPTPAMSLRQGSVSTGVSLTLAGLAMGCAQGTIPRFESKNPITGLALAVSAGAPKPTTLVGVTGFSLAYTAAALSPTTTTISLPAVPMAGYIGFPSTGATPDIDLSPTLDTVAVPYEDRTIKLNPEVSLLGIPAEQIVLYVSPDSPAEGETH